MHTNKTLSQSFRTDLDRQDKSSTRIIERELIARAQNGCHKSRNRLIQSHLGHIIQQAKAFNNSNISLDDMISEAVLGFNHAVQMFDLNCEGVLTTYSKAWIGAFISKAIKKSHLVGMSVKDAKALGKSYNSDDTMNVMRHQYERLDLTSDDGKSTRHESFIVNTDSDNEMADNEQYLALLDLLTPNSREYQIVEQYSQGITLASIGESIGLTKQRVHVILTKQLEMMRKRALISGIIEED